MISQNLKFVKEFLCLGKNLNISYLILPSLLLDDTQTSPNIVFYLFALQNPS
ncbi:MAG: hypothetical protein K0R28_609 [Paenibacillus sp.]|jgi:hypothetical protein|nr:hypothetical protein [Paenibacillus sp.]